MRYSILLFVGICSFCGCGGGHPAKLRVINGGWAVPQNLTVIVDGATVATGVNYPSCSNVCQELSNYTIVKSGGVDFVIETAGSTNNLVPSQFQRLKLFPNTQNTFVLAGGFGQYEGYLFTDDSTPASGSVKLRIAHADPTFPDPVTAWVNTDGSTTGNPTISGLTLGSASSYLTLMPGSYIETFAIPCFVSTICISVGPNTLSANQNLTVYVLNEGSSHTGLILADN